MIYLDHNASAPLSDASRLAVERILGGAYGNPSSIHLPGQRGRGVVEEAREAVAAMLGAEPGDIVFTSGATEANNLVWLGMGGSSRNVALTRNLVLTSAVEHPSILMIADGMAADPGRFDVLRVGVDENGLLLLDDVRGIVDEHAGRVTLLSFMAVNNETGVRFPIAELAALAHGAGAVMHTDATQAIGRDAVDVDALGVDLLSLSGHKIGALPGVGALYVRRGTKIEALFAGHQEDGMRGGTENIVGIASLGAAAERIDERIADMPRQRQLRDALKDRLLSKIEGAKSHAQVLADEETGNVLNIAFAGVKGASLVMALDVEGVAVSSGSACASGTQEPSHVLQAMAGSDAEGAIRISLGPATTAEQIDRTTAIIEKVVARMRAPM